MAIRRDQFPNFIDYRNSRILIQMVPSNFGMGFIGVQISGKCIDFSTNLHNSVMGYVVHQKARFIDGTSIGSLVRNSTRQFFVLRKIMVSILRPFPYRKNIEKMY